MSGTSGGSNAVVKPFARKILKLDVAASGRKGERFLTSSVRRDPGPARPCAAGRRPRERPPGQGVNRAIAGGRRGAHVMPPSPTVPRRSAARETAAGRVFPSPPHRPMLLIASEGHGRHPKEGVAGVASSREWVLPICQTVIWCGSDVTATRGLRCARMGLRRSTEEAMQGMTTAGAIRRSACFRGRPLPHWPGGSWLLATGNFSRNHYRNADCEQGVHCAGPASRAGRGRDPAAGQPPLIASRKASASCACR